MATQLIILNFNGTDGATTYTEEVSSLTPTTNTGVELDTDQKKFGTASLLINGTVAGSHNLVYDVPAFSGDLTIHYFYRAESFPSVSGYRHKLFYTWGLPSFYPSIEVALQCDMTDVPKLIVYCYDKDEVNFADYTGDNPFSVDTWYHLALIFNGRDMTLTIGGVEVDTWTASCDNPIDGLDTIYIAESPGTSGGKHWKDALEIVTGAKWTSFPFSPPTLPPEVEGEGSTLYGNVTSNMGMGDAVDSLLDTITETTGMGDSVDSLITDISDTAGMGETIDVDFIQYKHRLTGGVTLPLMEVLGQIGNNAQGEIVFPAMVVEVDVGKIIEIIAPVMTVDGTAIVGPAGTYGDVIFPVMEVEGTALTGIVASGEIVFPRKFLEVAGTTIFDPVNCAGAITFPSLSVNATATKSSLITGYCLNTSNLALSQYSNFEFITACEFNGKVICGGANGIFEHSGDLDVATEIDSYFDLPSSDYGTHNQKSFRKVFVEGESIGNLIVTTIIDDATGSSYTVDSLGVVGDNQYVFPLNHEDRGSNVGIRIANKHGADFTVNAVYGTLVIGKVLPKGYSVLARGKITFPVMSVSASAS